MRRKFDNLYTPLTILRDILTFLPWLRYKKMMQPPPTLTTFARPARYKPLLSPLPSLLALDPREAEGLVLG